MMQCPILHPWKMTDPSSCFHSSTNSIYHRHWQKPDQTQNISSRVQSKLANLEVSATHHLLCCTQAWTTAKIMLMNSYTKERLLYCWQSLCISSIMSQRNGLADTTQLGARIELSLVKELMVCHRGCAAVPALSINTTGTPVISWSEMCNRVLEEHEENQEWPKTHWKRKEGFQL